MRTKATIDVAKAVRLIQSVVDASIADTILSSQIIETYQRWIDQARNHAQHIHLPGLIAGSESSKALAATVSWHLVQMAAKQLDDLEDNSSIASDRRGVALNLATSLLFVAQQVLDIQQSGQENCQYAWQMRRALDHAWLNACSGQHVDLQTQTEHRLIEPDEWLQIAVRKSGAFFGWAAWAGGMASGADPHTCDAYQRFGECFGVLLQIADDFNDLWYSDDNEDLTRGSPNLAICYALTVRSGSDKEAYIYALQCARGGDLEASHQIKHDLVRWGAQGYMLVAARLQQLQAERALHSITGADEVQRSLLNLFEETFPPLRRNPDKDRTTRIVT